MGVLIELSLPTQNCNNFENPYPCIFIHIIDYPLYLLYFFELILVSTSSGWLYMSVLIELSIPFQNVNNFQSPYPYVLMDF